MNMDYEKTIANGASKYDILEVLEYVFSILEHQDSPYLEDAINRASDSGIILKKGAVK